MSLVENPDPNLINDDIRPTTDEERHWSVMNMASLWVGMVVCVPTYMLAAGLIEQGMSWGQAVSTVMLGNVIVLVPMILNGHPGTKYACLSSMSRAAFGINGATSRACCGRWWPADGSVSRPGSAVRPSINCSASSTADPSVETPSASWGSTRRSSCASWRSGPSRSQSSGAVWSPFACWRPAPFLIDGARPAGVGLREGGCRYDAVDPSQFAEEAQEGQFWSVFFPSLTAIPPWATLSLNIPDFTRYAKSQRDRVPVRPSACNNHDALCLHWCGGDERDDGHLR